MAIAQYLDDLLAQGIYCFSGVEASRALGSNPIATRAALRRARHKGEVAMPFRGFYVIVTPEHRKLGCLPANQFIPALMAHLDEPHYAGLLTAAEHHGAVHHRPQSFQVIAPRTRTGITCGGVRVDFIGRKNLADMPTQDFKTPRGYLKVSTSEVTAFDLAGYPHHAGGLDNAATVLSDLAENIDASKLVSIANLSPIAWSQRLGYLLELIGESELAEGLAEYITVKGAVPVPLSPSLPFKGLRQAPRWRLLPNEKVEPEI
ncbi:MAG: type IV toxin-antitoxin system AbiEi family antitoxin [Verrucomicrobia bacterium]|nr:type IV toxin-antitoxin system AbiEi family antitoxin [Deltaproteobacteria bacterium]